MARFHSLKTDEKLYCANLICLWTKFPGKTLSLLKKHHFMGTLIPQRSVHSSSFSWNWFVIDYWKEMKKKHLNLPKNCNWQKFYQEMNQFLYRNPQTWSPQTDEILCYNILKNWKQLLQKHTMDYVKWNIESINQFPQVWVKITQATFFKSGFSKQRTWRRSSSEKNKIPDIYILAAIDKTSSKDDLADGSVIPMTIQLIQPVECLEMKSQLPTHYIWSFLSSWDKVDFLSADDFPISLEMVPFTFQRVKCYLGNLQCFERKSWQLENWNATRTFWTDKDIVSGDVEVHVLGQTTERFYHLLKMDVSMFFIPELWNLICEYEIT